MPTLKEITNRAKKIRKAKPRTKWQNAIKQASKELKAAYRKKEGKIGAKKKAVKVTAKKTKKRISGYSGWTIKGKPNVIYGVIYRGSSGGEFEYITTSYMAAVRYRNKQKFGYDAMYIKEFIA